VLKGAVFFMADLMRSITVPCEIDFMAISSYGASTDSSGVVRILKDLDINIEDRHVLVVEDIIDSGLTLSYLGLTDQPRFLNAVAELETDRTPRELLDRLLEVERELGRVREGPRWGPRVIDLDLLLYGDRHVHQPGLDIPHPRLQERLFVLEPLAELAPDAVVPGVGKVAELLAKLESIHESPR